MRALFGFLMSMVLAISSAAAQPQTFGDYVNSLPTATFPLSATDQFYVRQGTVSKQAPGNLVGGIGGVSISGIPAAGYLPIATSSTTAAWSSFGTVLSNYAGPIAMTNTTVPASFSTPAYAFQDNGVTGLSFSDTATHFGFVVTGNTPSSAATGSYAAFISQQYAAGRSATAYVTGGEFQAIARSGNGNITGSNPVVIICGSAVTPPTGPSAGSQCPGTPAAVQSMVGQEINLFGFAGASAVYKEGLRIYDAAAFDAVGTGTLSAAINIGKAGTGSSGWQTGILFGDTNVGDNNFPVPAGALIKASTSTVEPARGIDFLGMAGFTDCAICLPANVGTGVNFGALGFGHGGRIISETTINGADLIFANNIFAVQFGGSINTILVTSSGTIFTGNVRAPDATAGTSTRSVCSDDAGNWFAKVGTC